MRWRHPRRKGRRRIVLVLVLEVEVEVPDVVAGMILQYSAPDTALPLGVKITYEEQWPRVFQLVPCDTQSCSPGFLTVFAESECSTVAGDQVKYCDERRAGLGELTWIALPGLADVS